MIIAYNIVYCVCDEEFDSFCCRFTTMSRVMEPGGCRIASPAWQTKSLGARRQYSQATVNNVLPLMTDSPTFLTRPPNIAHSTWMHGTLWNAIFANLIASEIDVIDTLRVNNDVDYLYRLATVLEMRLNHIYIGANRNAHGKRTVSTKQPQVKDLTVGLPDFGEVLS